MARFSSPASQAASVMKEVQGNQIRSVGTVRNYEGALTTVAEYVKAERICSNGLRELTPEQAITYLEQRAESVSQSTLNMERQAIQCMMQHVTDKLSPQQTITVIKSELEQALLSRAYTQEQISVITDRMRDKNSIPTEICNKAGLRAHEIYTLRPTAEQAPDVRPEHPDKFRGREAISYTVTGKGGLTREVQIPTELAERLESYRLDTPERVTDRNINYDRAYDINGGQKLSSSFSSASNRVLGFSHGIHGLRHTYAQERLGELMREIHLDYFNAREVISQELGHFRPDITEVYLR